MNNGDLTPHGNLGWNSQNNTTPPDRTSNNNFAIASMVIGIVSILFVCFPPAQLVLGVLAIMFAYLSKTGSAFTSYAMTGFIIGTMSCIVSFYFWTIWTSSLNTPEVLNYLNQLNEIWEEAYNAAYQQ